MLALTDDTLAEIISRVVSGMGVEAALAELNIDSNIGTAWLKAHPTAKAELAAAKFEAVTAKVAMDSNGRQG